MTSPVSVSLPLSEHCARTLVGSLWRCVVMLLAVCAVVVAGAWADSMVVIGSGVELATLASSVVALVIGVTAVFWLRARDGFLVPIVLGADCAGIGGAYTLRDGLLDGGRLHPQTLTVNISNVMATAGAVVLILTLVWAGISGHRHPRKPGSSIGDSARRPDAAA
ncbi:MULTISPECIES: hypothetical protein [unclassified Streptomyces]|uniref:hypothetical protein n=1 Tax=Streptomyces TaxID=1883 RepID=UPI00136B9930|nr:MULTISPECIES: hypothetical protein [unclassified Streptomyces]NDZ85189.1 hypothetical protein [Streptomyces sp. SID10115]NDZ99009.1 hypothetical protein [Streptomyces sp. SID10116]NEB44050.1 hypothetical protein [Streptomyces sp. SID339]